MATSERVRRVRAMFGVSERGGRARRVGRAAAALDRALRPAEVALIVGPSGSGKSTLGRALARRPACVLVGDGPGPDGSRRVIDLFESGLAGAMSCLARAGLADAAVMVARAGELSDGQRARLAIALGMERVPRGGTLIIDEFASTLDRPAAAALARTVRRWARERGARVVCITAHEDVLEWLGPRVLVVVGRDVKVVTRPSDAAAG